MMGYVDLCSTCAFADLAIETDCPHCGNLMVECEMGGIHPSSPVEDCDQYEEQE